jgi:hypothetical protein
VQLRLLPWQNLTGQYDPRCFLVLSGSSCLPGSGTVLRVALHRLSGGLTVNKRHFPCCPEPLRRIALLVLMLTIVLSLGFIQASADHASTTDRVRGLLEDNSENGFVGLYLKEVGNPVPLASFNPNTIFEPASTIKAVVHFHAVRQVQDGAVINGNVVTMATGIPWVADQTKFDMNNVYQPGGADCPNDNTVAMNTDLEQTLQFMMVPSDNATTEGLRAFFGDANIAATMAALNMNNTAFNHPLGCAGPTPNDLTLVDAGRLYEAVATGYLNEAHRNIAYGLMPTDGAVFNSIIDQEAVGLGLSNTAINAFKAQRHSALKAGSYSMGDGREHRSVAGWAELGHKNASCTITTQAYVYGAFINDSDIEPTMSIRTIGVELFREEIRHALETWAACEADLEIVSMSLVNPPAEINVNTPVQLTLNTVVRNNGPAAVVDAVLEVLPGADIDCTISPNVWTFYNQPGLAQGASVSVQTQYTVECNQPSFHSFTFNGYINPANTSVADPDIINNDGFTSVQVGVIAYADLHIADWDFQSLDAAQMADLLIGQDFVFPTTKTVGNNGDTLLGLYHDPVDAQVQRAIFVPEGVRGSVHVGGSEAPATITTQRPGELGLSIGNQPAGTVVALDGPVTITVTYNVSSLAIGLDRVIIEEFDLHCLEPGLHEIEFSSSIAAIDQHVLDPDPSNNVMLVDRTVECITPVQINIRPGNANNQVNLNSNQTIPVAILTTDAGEYGLPVAFDATTINHTTARFGTSETLNAGNGSFPSPDKDFIRDSFEMDDKTKDGDADMVLLVKLPGAGMVASTTEACMTGTYIDGGNAYTFYGCDAVKIQGGGN